MAPPRVIGVTRTSLVDIAVVRVVDRRLVGSFVAAVFQDAVNGADTRILLVRPGIVVGVEVVEDVVEEAMARNGVPDRYR